MKSLEKDWDEMLPGILKSLEGLHLIRRIKLSVIKLINCHK